MSFKTSFEWSFLKDFQITTFLDLMFNVSPPVGWLEFLWRLNITIIIIHTTWTLLYNSYNNIGLSGHFTKSIKTYGKAPIKQVQLLPNTYTYFPSQQTLNESQYRASKKLWIIQNEFYWIPIWLCKYKVSLDMLMQCPDDLKKHYSY